jgi:multicomponent Na+:H+ antiporter subunit G
VGTVLPWLADALIVIGVFIMTVGVYGIVRMPNTYTRLHAASKAVFLGVISLLTASAVTGDPAIVLRAVLIGAFLLLTTPVSAHVIGLAAFQRNERMGMPDAIDESGRGLAGPEEPKT